MNSFKWLLAVLLVLIPLNVLADRGGEGTGTPPIGPSGMTQRSMAAEFSCIGGQYGQVSPHGGGAGGAVLNAYEFTGANWGFIASTVITHPDEASATYGGRAYFTYASSGVGTGGFADIFSVTTPPTGAGLFIRDQGFWSIQNFALNNNVATHIGYFGVGVEGALAPVNTDPDAAGGRNHSIAMYFRTADGVGANWRLQVRAGSSAAQTTFDLGANCVRSTTNVLQLAIYCPPAAREDACYVRVRNITAGADCLANGGTAGGWARFSGANLPGSGQELVQENYIQDGTAGGGGTAPVVAFFGTQVCRNLLNVIRD